MSSFLSDKVVPFFKKILNIKDPKQHYADTIITNSKGEILLLQRSYNDDMAAGGWCLAGGKIDAGENAEEAAQREVQEETGLELTCTFIKTIEKENCVINYFQAQLKNDSDLIVVDNEEHYRYDFVLLENLDRYDLIFDLKEILEDLYQYVIPAVQTSSERLLTPEEEKFSGIKKSFDLGEIDEDDYLIYLQINSAIKNITKGFEEGKVSTEEYNNAIEKSKHYEFVKVVRDGKQFMQYRQVGTNKIDEDIEVGDQVSTSDKLELFIKKYSDKSFLITGDTYKNLELLRKIKSDAGVGTWNKTLKGWVFPLTAKASILSNLAENMEIGTYDETIAKEAVIDLKNSVDVGTPVEIDGVKTTVEEVSVNEEGKIEYTLAIEPEGSKEELNELMNLFDWAGSFLPEEEAKEEEPKEIEIPIGTISPDGKAIKTADGWEYIKQEPKKVTEKEIAIPPADDKKAEELINNATEENRAQTGKELFGKEAGVDPVSVEIEKNGMEDIKIEVKEFSTPSGEKIKAMDFTEIKKDQIQLSKQEDILNKPKPFFIPDINQSYFSGSFDDRFVFDYVRLEDDKYLISLNGFEKRTHYVVSDRSKDSSENYAVVNLDNLVAISDYYIKKRKAELKKEADEKNAYQVSLIPTWGDYRMSFKPFSYDRLSAKQQEKYSPEKWESLSMEQKLLEVPKMKDKPIQWKSASRIKEFSDSTYMNNKLYPMYKFFINKAYFTDRSKSITLDPCVKEYVETKKLIAIKRNDLEIQREDNDSTFEKGRETSYGDSGTKDILLDSHGVLVKRQNGDEINEAEVNKIKENLDKVFESFGDRSSMSRNFGLKISHAGAKNMHAKKAIGLYIPAYKAIGVSDNAHGKFGFTLAHEYAHFFDHWAGSKSNRHFASDDYQSTAGKIASLFRENMNQKTDDAYLQRSCECFARSFEQYHAMKHNGKDAIKSLINKIPYHSCPEHVNIEKFNTIIKPLIEQFIQENDHLLKSAYDELNIIDINNNFEIIKAGFDSLLINEEKYLEYLGKFNEIVKGDPSHGGKLVKKQITDKKGHKQTEWVKRGEEQSGDKEKSNNDLEPVKHSKNVLATYAAETPEKELKRVINESHDEKLRKAAHLELDRRNKKEKPQDDKKTEAKKKVEVKPKATTEKKPVKEKKEVTPQWFDKFKQYNLNNYPLGVPESEVEVNEGDKNNGWCLRWKSPTTKKTVYGYTPEALEKGEVKKWERSSLITKEFIDEVKNKSLDGLKSKDETVKQSAAAIFIVANTGLRIGSEDAFNQSGNEGVTTLSPKSVNIEGDTVNFEFIGKSYHKNVSQIKSKELAEFMTDLKEKAEKDKAKFLFDKVDRSDVDRIFKKNFGGDGVEGMKIKDMRTYKATEQAVQFLYDSKIELSGNEKKDIKAVGDVFKDLYNHVSNVLNNSPSMAKNAYINPKIRMDWLDKIGYKGDKEIFKSMEDIELF